MCKRKIVVLALMVLGLTGCSASMVILPDNVGNYGLLVGQVSSSTWPGVRYAKPRITHPEPVGLKEYMGGRRGDTIVIPLLPGEYTFNDLEEVTGSDTVSTGYSNITTTYFRRYPVARKFTITKGMATNVGMIVYEPTKSKLFGPQFLDNTEELTDHVRDRHPKLFASLASDKFVKSIDAPLAGADLEGLRKTIGLRRALSKMWRYEHPTDMVVSGNAGTLLRIGKDHAGKYSLNVLNTGTTVDLSDCGIHSDRAVCVLSRNSFLLLNDGKVTRLPAPGGAAINSGSAFGKAGVLLVDDHMRLHISQDNATSWQVFEGAKRKEPVSRTDYDLVNVSSFGIHLGKSGYFVFEKGADGDEAPMIFGDYGGKTHRVIQLPETVDNIRTVKEVESGLFVGPGRTFMMDDQLHYLAADTQQWSAIPLPTGSCSDMVVLDEQGRHIEVRCGSDDVRVTEDRGKTWGKRTLRMSYFNEK